MNAGGSDHKTPAPAAGKPAHHIPYTAVPITAAANCDGCHKGSTTTWTNGRLHNRTLPGSVLMFVMERRDLSLLNC